MPATINPDRYDISASSMGSFKACPVRFKLAYREGLRTAADTDSQRMGTNWHAMHEVYHGELSHARKVTAEIKDEYPNMEGDDGTDVGRANGLNAVVNHLNERYANMPATKTLAEWSLERQQLLTSFVGYLWHYENDPVEAIASEVAFELPVYEPRTGMPLPLTEVRRVGKIDHVIKWHGMVGALERKSTSRSIEPDSDYWEKSRKDTQVSMYALAFREMQYDAKDGNTWIRHAETETLLDLGQVEQVGMTLYDVWHKPTIKPAMLSQKDTAAFIESGMYCGQSFTVKIAGDDPTSMVVAVNDYHCEIEPGKKGFAIRETIEMYGARLLQDITERPGFYFQRREIARTDKDLAEFRRELYAVYQTQKLMEKHHTWFSNESQCRATFPCPFIPVCYGPGHVAVSKEHLTPDGFKRIFVDLTVNGEAPEE